MARESCDVSGPERPVDVRWRCRWLLDIAGQGLSSAVLDNPGRCITRRPRRVVALMSTNHDARTYTSKAVQDAADLCVAQAQGVLSERYCLSLETALLVLERRAQGAGIPLVEAARWLLSSGTLP